MAGQGSGGDQERISPESTSFFVYKKHLKQTVESFLEDMDVIGWDGGAEGQDDDCLRLLGL